MLTLTISAAGKDLTMTNYLLLTLAVFQFPFLFWMTNIHLPELAWGTHMQAVAGAAATVAGVVAPPLLGKSPAAGADGS